MLCSLRQSHKGVENYLFVLSKGVFIEYINQVSTRIDLQMDFAKLKPEKCDNPPIMPMDEVDNKKLERMNGSKEL